MSLVSAHPIVSALYFISVLVITMFSVNPYLLIIALFCGVLFFAKVKKYRNCFRELGFYLLLFVTIALTNPLFSHNGVTTLFFLNGNPITLEAILYGIDIAIMLIAVVYWFKCFNLVMTEDKLLYIFGRLSPKIAILISSALRFIPLMGRQAEKIRLSQKSMGLFASDTWTDKIRGTLRVYSALITWALENAIDAGSSMKARGYGLRGRTHYSLYRFKKTDAVLIAVIAVLDAIVLAVVASGQLSFSFYPQITVFEVNTYTLSAIGAFAVLSLLPLILEVKEGLQWKYYRSKI